MIWDVLFWTGIVVAALLAAWLITWLVLGARYIPHRSVGIIEKLWSQSGSLAEGRIIALNGEAGYQAKLLRGGLHLGYPFWKFSVHKVPLVTVGEGRIGYVYARDGRPLPPEQTLGSTAPCNSFQDAAAFINNSGQRGRQRGILREGTYAINTALFVVITEQAVYAGPLPKSECVQLHSWQNELSVAGGFCPVRVGSTGRSTTLVVKPQDGDEVHLPDSSLTPQDNIGVITVHDGPTLQPGEFIAPQAGGDEHGAGHNYFQDPEQFLTLGGRRGRQLQVLTDGTYFINRWFATVELRPKTLIPIGYVGVVISYYGQAGEDVTGSQFRYGEQVSTGHRGVWRDALTPGKYALNPYALKVELVPTVNFVLRWISGQTESHRYDESLASIPIITADAYEPLLPLSLVLHIDYEKAPRVVQRFGDVRRLISQTLDPILTAYFRDVAQSSNMLDLLTHREDIQKRATTELGRRFSEYDINCVAVLIGRPESDVRKLSRGGEDPIEALFDQLRMRRLADEQRETFAKQQEAAVRLKELNHAQAEAERQTHLTATKVEIEISSNRGAAQLAEAQNMAKREVTLAEGQSRAARLLGEGEAARIAQIGEAEARVSEQKVAALGDPRLYALREITDKLTTSQQPLVPERLIMLGGGGGGENGNTTQASLFQ
ncbi:MAG TPA: SPFH domain-containing protein, partial [Verrucomicrobiales bacterium]|nr:SPFH domain-containing protein [Verrucomicrobiales bacterium]